MINLSVYKNLDFWILGMQWVIFIVFCVFFLKFFINIFNEYKKKTNMKVGFKEYWKPTPKKIRKIADSLSAAALAVSAFTFVSDYKVVSYVVLASAFIGKFASNLFSEDEEKSNSL